MLQPSHRMVTPSVKEMDGEDWRGLGSAPPSRIACYLEGTGPSEAAKLRSECLLTVSPGL